MTRRRFAILVAAVVSVNAFFWLAQGGFALPQAMIDRFFGPRMIRAEVIVGGAGGTVQDFRIDRGVITAVLPGALTLRERDGTVVTIPVSPTARLIAPPRFTDISQLRPLLRVLVVRKANAPATVVEVEPRL